MAFCSAVTLCFAAVFAVVSALLLAIGFSTDHWQTITVNRDKLQVKTIDKNFKNSFHANSKNQPKIALIYWVPDLKRAIIYDRSGKEREGGFGHQQAVCPAWRNEKPTLASVKRAVIGVMWKEEVRKSGRRSEEDQHVDGDTRVREGWGYVEFWRRRRRRRKGQLSLWPGPQPGGHRPLNGAASGRCWSFMSGRWRPARRKRVAATAATIATASAASFSILVSTRGWAAISTYEMVDSWRLMVETEILNGKKRQWT